MKTTSQDTITQKEKLSLRNALQLGTAITLPHAIETFMHVALSGQKNSTQNWYKTRLTSLSEYVNRRPMTDLQAVDILDWYTTIEDSDRSTYTAHGYARATRRFIKWCHKWGLITDNITDTIELPALPQLAKYGITESNIERMLEAAKDNPRDYAILCFFESTGCRLEGAATAKLDYVDLEKKRVLITEKFTKQRTVFLNDRAIAAITEYLNVRPPTKADELFVGKDPFDDHYHSINNRAIYDRFQIYAKKANIAANWSPHQWRHRFGRVMAQSGINLGMLSQIMGHASVLITVKFYGQFSVDHLQQAYEKYQRKN